MARIMRTHRAVCLFSLGQNQSNSFSLEYFVFNYYSFHTVSNAWLLRTNTKHKWIRVKLNQQPTDQFQCGGFLFVGGFVYDFRHREIGNYYSCSQESNWWFFLFTKFETNKLWTASSYLLTVHWFIMRYWYSLLKKEMQANKSETKTQSKETVSSTRIG